eukprot:TRINITY_DN26892_c0_g1_i1.p1 TRINITY_DN26892_c0_g1~~TRINITY_DN26892_c0_g1_i1.p1  ORF type:complete len:279 (+),score=39.32 TRINITY_DN26892_c0_g1_i1:44-880(+)
MEAKVTAMSTELSFWKGKVREEAIRSLMMEESRGRAEIQKEQMEVTVDGYMACFNVGKLAAQVGTLTKEVRRVKREGVRDVGTNPPHHPVGRTAVPLHTLTEIELPRSSSLSPGRNRFSPQRYREPTTHSDAKLVIENLTKYIHEERMKPSRVPIPTWVVTREEAPLRASPPSTPATDATDEAHAAITSFMSSMSKSRETFTAELERKQERLQSLVPPPVLRVPSAEVDPAVARIKQKLQSLSNDLAQTTQHAMQQKSSTAAAKADLHAARISLASAT